MSKTGKIILALITIFGIATTLQAEAKRYEVKSGIVEYKIEGGGSLFGFSTKTEGKTKLYFKEWGNVELRETDEKSETMGQIEKDHSITKIDHGTVYSVNKEDKTIVKSDMSMLKQMDKEGKNLSVVGKDMMKQMGGKKTGSEKILGYPCEIWEVMGSKIWIYKGVPLKTEANIMGIKHLEIATSAKFGVKIPDEKFKLPNYPVKTLNQIIEDEMKKSSSQNTQHQTPPKLTPEQMQQMQQMMESLGNMFQQAK